MIALMRKPLCGLLLLLAVFAGQPARAAERILALAPHVCEMLYVLGAESRIVGAVDYCDYPPAAKALPRVGGYTGINVEAALRLRPDLAIAMDRGVKGVRRLEALGVRVVVSHPASVEEMLADMLRLGRLLHCEARAARRVAALRHRLMRVRARVARLKHRPRVFYELWPDPLLTAGGASFISDLIREAGGATVNRGLRSGGDGWAGISGSWPSIRICCTGRGRG